MRVGVGFSDNSDSEAAGVEAARQALDQAGELRDCDLAMLFSTAHHDPVLLREAVGSVVGRSVCVVGGAAVGAITRERFGYGGEQVGLAAIWLDGARCAVLSRPNLVENELEVGRMLGRDLARLGTDSSSPTMLFYDAINRSHGDVRLNLATPLLEGIEQGLGFLPNLTGAGLQGDYECSPVKQWIGADIVEHTAFMLAFSGEVAIDSVIMHGCRPSGPYYTVTRAERQTILEIEGRPALSFMRSVMPSLPVEAYPFYMILGVNRGDPEVYDENFYSNRLCLAVDKARDGIVMFESDMVAGTRFQVMYRSLDLDYMAPRVEWLFNRLGDRRPVFGFYIDCAGRAAKYGGEDLEDAVVLQSAVGGRVPLLGIYSGVEIAPIMGRPRTLDWTGVFCLFSVPK